MNIRTGVALLLMAGLTACSAITEPPRPTAPPPTLTPEGQTPEQAERIARLFLQAWQDGDLAGMHSLLTFGGQEATTLPAFSDFYRRSQTTMTLRALETRVTSQLPGAGGLMTFGYDVTFHTNQVGSFLDGGRTLRLAWDSRLRDWRVVWSPGDLLTAMAEGGTLRLDARLPSRANIYDRATAGRSPRATTASSPSTSSRARFRMSPTATGASPGRSTSTSPSSSKSSPRARRTGSARSAPSTRSPGWKCARGLSRTARRASSNARRASTKRAR